MDLGVIRSNLKNVGGGVTGHSPPNLPIFVHNLLFTAIRSRKVMDYILFFVFLFFAPVGLTSLGIPLIILFGWTYFPMIMFGEDF